MIHRYRLYSQRYGGNVGYVPFLAPWWGVPPEDPTSLNCGQYRQWALHRPEHYELVHTAADAEVFILSIPWKATRNDPASRAFADEQIAESRKLGAKIVIFFDSDHDESVTWPEHAIVLRFSIYSDSRNKREFAIPPFSQDLLPAGRSIQIHPKVDIPGVSFCGYAPPLGCRIGFRALREAGRYLAYRTHGLRGHRSWVAHAPRVRALTALRKNQDVMVSFLFRDSFAFNQWGVLQPGGTAARAVRQRAEFVDNLAGSDYSLAARGLANCSIRFSEALSLGRIPLFINTCCVLPYDWLVDWRSTCVWVEEGDVADIGAILREQHQSLSTHAFVERQRLARILYEKWLSPEGFFSKLYLHFERADGYQSK